MVSLAAAAEAAKAEAIDIFDDKKYAWQTWQNK
jgi:hypothetical protein